MGRLTFDQYQVLEVFRPLHLAFALEWKKLYLVGGSVRDLMWGYPVKDWDFCTDARPEKVREILASAGAHLIEKNGGNFGTVHCVWNDLDVEITTFRVDKDYPMGDRRPVVEFSESLWDDLRRRDFTINALCLDAYGSLVDVSQLYEDDLARRYLTSPQNPLKLFQDDPLRIFRMYRFWFKYGLTIDPKLRMAARYCAPAVKLLSKERIHDELIKISQTPCPHEAFRAMMEDGIWHQIVPMLPWQVGYDQRNPHHDRTLWEHTLSTVEEARILTDDYRVILGALFHDIAKPGSLQLAYHCDQCYKSQRDEKVDPHAACDCGGTYSRIVGHYTLHDVRGADVTREILTGLKFSNEDIEFISGLVLHHNIQYNSKWSNQATRRFLNRVGDLFDPLMVLTRADRLAHADSRKSIKHLEELEREAKWVPREQVIKPKPLVSGQVVMDLFLIKPGPRVGEILDQLLKAQIDGDVLTDHDAWKFLVALKEREQLNHESKYQRPDSGSDPQDGVPIQAPAEPR